MSVSMDPNMSRKKIQHLISSSDKRVDRATVPRPTVSKELPVEESQTVYVSGDFVNQTVPRPISRCIIRDRGIASYRILRITHGTFPAKPETTEMLSIPLGGLLKPFCLRREKRESSVPIADLRVRMTFPDPNADPNEQTEGPVRCPQCRAFINPMMIFTGSSAECNFCHRVFNVPNFYLNLLDQWKRKSSEDSATRHELLHGVVDFCAVKSMFPDGNSKVEEPPASYVIVVEATHLSVNSGLVSSVCQILEHLLDELHDLDTTIALIFYDDHLHFFPSSVELLESVSFRAEVVTDVEDPFVPVPHDQLFHSIKSRTTRQLLRFVPEYFTKLQSAKTSSPSCGFSATNVAFNILGARGGGLVSQFVATSPNKGYASTDRNHVEDKKKFNIFSLNSFTAPAISSIIQLAKRQGIGFHVFACPTPNTPSVDLLTFGTISLATGGRTHHYAPFDPARNGEQLYYDLRRILSTPFGRKCILRIRVSRGYEIETIFSSFYPTTSDFVEIPTIGPDTTLGFTLKHTGIAPSGSQAAIQVAVLYTSNNGSKFVRSINTSVPTSSRFSTIIKNLDHYAICGIYARKGATAALFEKNKNWKDDVLGSFVRCLAAYRLHMATNSPATQLVLPESLKTTTVCISGLFRHKAFRPVLDVKIDQRIHSLGILLNSDALEIDSSLYPKLYKIFPLDNSSPLVGTPTGIDNDVYLPPTLSCNGESVTSDGIYLCENSEVLFLYIGSDVSPDVMNSIFLSNEGTNKISDNLVFNTGTPNSDLLLSVIKQIRKDRDSYPWLSVCVVLPRTLEESSFIWQLVEDRLGSETGYVDFLCQLYDLVSKQLSAN
eukprot:GHVP01052872.1.p1 GENE.GHVP01052872.1~~GHVP01052872.1.p1  ORF type:complete len:832 (-),score=118.38 GHVP01052872.1:1329-3824(-)